MAAALRAVFAIACFLGGTAAEEDEDACPDETAACIADTDCMALILGASDNENFAGDCLANDICNPWFHCQAASNPDTTANACMDQIVTCMGDGDCHAAVEEADVGDFASCCANTLCAAVATCVRENPSGFDEAPDCPAAPDTALCHAELEPCVADSECATLIATADSNEDFASQCLRNDLCNPWFACALAANDDPGTAACPNQISTCLQDDECGQFMAAHDEGGCCANTLCHETITCMRENGNDEVPHCGH
eukprot:SAG31_NODE_11928_length_985_cov_1.075621_1_plen_252_part_00